jgi:hypothetical protein
VLVALVVLVATEPEEFTGALDEPFGAAGGLHDIAASALESKSARRARMASRSSMQRRYQRGAVRDRPREALGFT